MFKPLYKLKNIFRKAQYQKDYRDLSRSNRIKWYLGAVAVPFICNPLGIAILALIAIGSLTYSNWKEHNE